MSDLAWSTGSTFKERPVICEKTKNKLLICLQHFLAGLVIDWWNITNELGGVAYCYYANWGKAPLLFDNNHEKNPIQKPIFEYINSLNNTVNTAFRKRVT